MDDSIEAKPAAARFEPIYAPVGAHTIRQNIDPLEVLSVDAAADLIGCTVQSIYRTPNHKLPRYQVGSELRIFRRDALLYLVTYGRPRSRQCPAPNATVVTNGESVGVAVKRLRGGVRERSQTQRRTQ
jgi:hypothetical protein